MTASVFLPEWNALPADERFAKMARQGGAYPMVEAVTVTDPKTMIPVPRDGTSVGEIKVTSRTRPQRRKRSSETAASQVTLPFGIRMGQSRIKDRSKDILRRREYFEP